MKQATITLAGIDYEIRELPVRKNREWRQKLEQVLQPLIDVAEAAPTIQVSTDNLKGVIDAVRPLIDAALGSTDILIDMVFAYVPNLEREREAIEAEAYDSEFVAAFQTCMGLAYGFFGQVLGQLNKLPQNLPNGSQPAQTSQN